MTDLNRLWGSTLTSLTIDIARQKIVVELQLLFGESLTDHIIECSDVSDFRFFSSIPSPWSYAEATEIRASVSDSNQLVLEILLWSEDAGLLIEAKSLTVDGDPIHAEAKGDNPDMRPIDTEPPRGTR